MLLMDFFKYLQGQKFGSKISASLSNSAIMSTLATRCRWKEESEEEDLPFAVICQG